MTRRKDMELSSGLIQESMKEIGWMENSMAMANIRLH